MKNLKNILAVSILSLGLFSTNPVLANENILDNETITNINTLSVNTNFENLNISIKSDSIENEEELKTTIFGLPQNMGPIDRSIRGVIAAGLIGTGIYGLSTGNIGKEVSGVLLGVSVIPIATASTGYCPLYQLFGLKYSF